MGMEIVELFMRAEEEFEVEILPEEAQNLTTVGALASYIASKLPGSDSAEVLQRVRLLVADETSIPVERVQLESRFVEDLDLD